MHHQRCSRKAAPPRKSPPLLTRSRWGGGKRKAASSLLLSWPQALRVVRGWLEPYVMLMRYWRAYSEKPPPKELEALLERVFSGRGLYLYVQ